MKRFKTGLLLAAALLAAAFPSEALASSKIDKVRINIEVKDDLDAGDTISSDVLDITTNDDEYEIIDYHFQNSGDTWRRGDTPLIVIDLESYDYTFSSESRSYFTISGDRSPSFRDADRYDDNHSMELIVKLRTINSGTNADTGSDQVWWDDNEACWEEVDDARDYEVRLYRDGSLVTTVKTDDTDYDFTGKMTKRGDYSFRVRARYSSSSYSSWSDFSEEYYVSSSDASDNADDGDSGSGPGGSSGSSNKGPGASGSGSSGSTLPSSGWMLNTYGWWYRFSDGTNPANSWQNINYSWYFFASSGYMHTGWLNWNNQWYYLKPSSGAMVSGWYPIDGQWYYLNESGVMQTGWIRLNNIWYYLLPNGVMATGWNNVNEVWYYMDASGAMYANAWTPDGHYVNENGAMVQ